MSDLEQLIKLVTGQHRWAIHPIKVGIALLLPVTIVWLADWRMRRLSSAYGVHDEPIVEPLVDTAPPRSALGD